MGRAERKAEAREEIVRREQHRDRRRQISRILHKPAAERSPGERELLESYAELVQELEKTRQRRERLRYREQEVVDGADILQKKVLELAEAVRGAENMVIYTGAGISTAAAIPDYRGPSGVWTLLNKGRSVSTGDLSEAEPTFTHMCIARLHKAGLVQHVVSQNCDGLHLRSGLPRDATSEVHGNMYIEVCTSCSPPREYVRLFDVTERTALHKHNTGRSCHKCKEELRDSIVHFGERGKLAQPLNWVGAVKSAKAADVILCLGSSLKFLGNYNSQHALKAAECGLVVHQPLQILKKYHCLWGMNRPSNRRPKLYIVNLQWTPKDALATLKIHGKCDEVMQLLVDELKLDIPEYNRMEVEHAKDHFWPPTFIQNPWTPSSLWPSPCAQENTTATAVTSSRPRRPPISRPPSPCRLSVAAGSGKDAPKVEGKPSDASCPPPAGHPSPRSFAHCSFYNYRFTF